MTPPRRSRPIRRAFAQAWAWLAVVALAFLPAPVRAQDADATLERQVKAAFLYKFIPYVEWPASAFARPDSPVVIAVAGPDAIVAEIASVVANREVQGRPVQVRRLREIEPLAAHIVFVTRSEQSRLPAIAKAAQASGTLVVSESDGALAQGSMINFMLSEGRVRFDIALGPVERAGLRISARLLAVASTVRPAGS